MKGKKHSQFTGEPTKIRAAGMVRFAGYYAGGDIAAPCPYICGPGDIF